MAKLYKLNVLFKTELIKESIKLFVLKQMIE